MKVSLRWFACMEKLVKESGRLEKVCLKKQTKYKYLGVVAIGGINVFLEVWVRE